MRSNLGVVGKPPSLARVLVEFRENNHGEERIRHNK